MGQDSNVLRLPPAAEPVWQAYCAMLESKDRHFSELKRQTDKRNERQEPSLAEGAYLEHLLREHDRRVQEFSRTMRELGRRDRLAQAQLLTAITHSNRELGDDSATN